MTVDEILKSDRPLSPACLLDLVRGLRDFDRWDYHTLEREVESQVIPVLDQVELYLEARVEEGSVQTPPKKS